jgi:murein DD-endopeptidase MepM/ murein hydrolase activator NlpD
MRRRRSPARRGLLLGVPLAGAVTAVLLLGRAAAPEPATIPAVVPAPEPAPPAGPDTGLVIPVRGVTPDRLRDTYRDARGLGRRHDAIDIDAPRGTPVLSVAAAVVLKLFQSDRGGTTLYALAMDRRTIYYYAHLDRYAAGIREGAVLEAGEVIGYVGDTGNATPGDYHLHFEVSTTTDPRKYWGGTPVNPYPLLRGGRPMP